VKKILLPLFFIATSIGITQLSAYCFYNNSKDKTISLFVFSKKLALKHGGFLAKRALYNIKPGQKYCRNWKDIDKKNRAKEWYWVAYKGSSKGRIITLSTKRLGEGYFPIGGAVYFSGWYKDAFSISYDGKEWEYWKSPWKHKKQPWKTHKN